MAPGDVIPEPSRRWESVTSGISHQHPPTPARSVRMSRSNEAKVLSSADGVVELDVFGHVGLDYGHSRGHLPQVSSELGTPDTPGTGAGAGRHRVRPRGPTASRMPATTVTESHGSVQR